MAEELKTIAEDVEKILALTHGSYIVADDVRQVLARRDQDHEKVVTEVRKEVWLEAQRQQDKGDDILATVLKEVRLERDDLRRKLERAVTGLKDVSAVKRLPNPLPDGLSLGDSRGAGRTDNGGGYPTLVPSGGRDPAAAESEREGIGAAGKLVRLSRAGVGLRGLTSRLDADPPKHYPYPHDHTAYAV